MVRLALAASLVVAIFIGWWISDESLNRTAHDWLDTPTREANDAYYFLLGFGAPEGSSPQLMGRRLVAEYDTLTVAPSWLPDLSGHNLLCAYDGADCLLLQQSRTSEARVLIAESDVLLQRYRQFLSFEAFVADLPASIRAPAPRYELLTTAARLQSLTWALSDDPGTGLRQEIDQLRRLLTGYHTQAGKLSVTTMLTEKLRLAALLAQQGKMDYLEPAPLSAQERDLSSAVLSEFRFLMQGVEAVGKPDGGTGPTWYTRLWFRPNMTINQIMEYLRHIEALSRQPASEQIAQPRYDLEPSLSRHLRNPAGNRLVAIIPSLNRLPESLLRLGQQLALLSWMAGSATSTTHPNPWAPALAPERGKDGLCFTRPGHQPMVCLPLLP